MTLQKKRGKKREKGGIYIGGIERKEKGVLYENISER